ncbi:MAG: hypothetical protein HY904_04525 [Deltaproteobacteria bacterium]|nr:hypothetical protein [Deltaproteobacteria bacterium]
MRNSATLVASLALCLLWASPASGADRRDDETAALAGQPAPRKLNEVERGLWFSLEAAPLTHLDWVSTLPPKNIPRTFFPDDNGLGFRAGVRGGYDIIRLVSVEGYLVSQVREKRVRRGRSYTGDLADFNLGVALGVVPVTLWDRLAFSGRVALGVAALAPGEVAAANANPACIPPPSGSKPTDINPLCLALPGIRIPANPISFQPFPPVTFAVTPTAEVMGGVEYYTHLRHFSVGADLVLGTMVWPLQLHAAIVPRVKYSF